ncbi:MAG: NAD-dependent epimerase/dehydratase family protein [Rhodomicrobium sp.]
MKRVLLTGASGAIGSRLRSLLRPLYELVLSDIEPPHDLQPQEAFFAADLADASAIERAAKGVEGIIHLGGESAEAPWETILRSNIIGIHNLFEAARKQGVKRVVFASSNHAVGFYPRAQRIGPQVLPLPDTRYGVSKAFGESLGALYAYKYGLGVFCIRIGNVSGAPADERRLAIWLKPEDLVSLLRIGLEREGLVYEVVYGVSDNARGWWDNSRASELGYQPEGHSEDFANQALAAQAGLPSDEIGDLFQGGSFCSLEFEAPLSRVAPKD